jgi:hypothetical protein
MSIAKHEHEIVVQNSAFGGVVDEVHAPVVGGQRMGAATYRPLPDLMAFTGSAEIRECASARALAALFGPARTRKYRKQRYPS